MGGRYNRGGFDFRYTWASQRNLEWNTDRGLRNQARRRGFRFAASPRSRMLALPLAVVGTHCKHRSFPRMPCCVSRLFVETRQTDLTVFVCWVTTVTCELGASLFLHRFLLPNALSCLWAGGLKGPPRSRLCLHPSTPYHTAYRTLSLVLFKALSICHIVSLSSSLPCCATDISHLPYIFLLVRRLLRSKPI